MAILRTEKAMIRAMCRVKSIEKRSSQELVDLLGLEETSDRRAKVNGGDGIDNSTCFEER